MADATNNKENPPSTPVYDSTSLLPPKHPKPKDKPPGSHADEIAEEIEDGQVSPGDLSSENDI